MTNIIKERHAGRWFGAAFSFFCILTAVAIPAGATARSIAESAASAVLTLEEAARFMRVEPALLAELALRNQVPARRVGAHWRFNREALLAWLNGDWSLIARAVPPPAEPLTLQFLGQVSGRGTTLVQNEASSSSDDEAAAPGTPGAPEQTAQDEQAETIGEAPTERTAEETFLRRTKVLLAPGEVTLDTGLFYSQSDNQQLALVNGSVGLATLDEETFTTLLSGRVGVWDETELFASTTFRDQQSDVLFGTQRISESERTEFGDVRLGVRHTLLHEGPGLPDVIATLDGRIPTADTSYAVGGGVALVKSIDPVVLFANTNYRHTFSREFSDVTRLEAEDRFDASVGYALGLNDTLTLSMAVSGLLTSATDFDNAQLSQSDTFSLQFGLTSWLAKGLYIEPSVSFALDGPGDSFTLGVAVPYTFTP